MRAVLASLVLLVAGCTAPPVEEREPLVYLTLHGEDVSVGAAVISRASGRKIVVEPGIEDPIVLNLGGVRWRVALERLWEEGLCRVVKQADGSFLVKRPQAVEARFERAHLHGLLRYAAGCAGVNAVVASDVAESVSFDFHEIPNRVGFLHQLHRLIEHFRLETVQVGAVLVVSHAHLVDDIPEGQNNDPIWVYAEKAPAEGWFDLMERVTGRRVDHGLAPISVGIRVEAPVDDVLRATALASRVSRRKPLEDLLPLPTDPSSAIGPLTLQGSVSRGNESWALVNGRVVTEGDRLTSDVSVVRNGGPCLWLSEEGTTFVVQAH